MNVIERDQTLYLSKINDYIQSINDEYVDLAIDEIKNTIYIPHNFNSYESECFDDFKLFIKIKSLITKPFDIWYATESGGEWYINFLIYDGKQYFSYVTDDIDDFVLSLDEDSESYDDDRGNILANLNLGYLDDDKYPKLPKDINNIQHYEYQKMNLDE